MTMSKTLETYSHELFDRRRTSCVLVTFVEEVNIAGICAGQLKFLEPCSDWYSILDPFLYS